MMTFVSKCRPFWYHSLTRKTTYIDPEGKGKYAYALENLLEKDAFRLEYERIVAESDINELRNAHVQSADASKYPTSASTSCVTHLCQNFLLPCVFNACAEYTYGLQCNAQEITS